MMDWTEIYRDAVGLVFSYERGREQARTGEAKPCRIIPCPGSYFPAHDEQCEMEWQEDETGWGWFTDCECEPRARMRRDREAVDG